MDCRHIQNMRVDDCPDATIFYVSGTGREILDALEPFPTGDCIVQRNIKEETAREFLKNNPVDYFHLYVLFDKDPDQAMLFKLTYE